MGKGEPFFPFLTTSEPPLAREWQKGKDRKWGKRKKENQRGTKGKIRRGKEQNVDEKENKGKIERQREDGQMKEKN